MDSTNVRTGLEHNVREGKWAAKQLKKLRTDASFRLPENYSIEELKRIRALGYDSAEELRKMNSNASRRDGRSASSSVSSDAMRRAMGTAPTSGSDSGENASANRSSWKAPADNGIAGSVSYFTSITTPTSDQ